MKSKLEIAMDHDARAKAQRRDALEALKKDNRKEHDRLQLQAAFHSIQSALWYKSLANFGE